MMISWTPPDYNGGMPITGYTVEYKEVSSIHWNSIKVVARSCVIKGLEESHSYRFRVAAKNAFGLGPFSELSNVKTIGKIIYSGKL